MAKASKKGASAPASTASNVVTTETVTAAPAAPAAPAKAPKPAPIVANGVQRPKAGGLCAAVWDITEAGMTSGENGPNLPDIAQVKAKAQEAGLNPTNVSIEYYRCRQFHGVRGRQAKPQVAEQAPAT